MNVFRLQNIANVNNVTDHVQFSFSDVAFSKKCHNTFTISIRRESHQADSELHFG